MSSYLTIFLERAIGFFDTNFWRQFGIDSIRATVDRHFNPIFMKITWLVRVHSWVNLIVFGNNRPNGTTDMGENAPLKPVFRV